MKETYLYKLYRADKLLFYAIAVFILGQLFFTIKGVETFPWLNYGMYSQPVTTVKQPLTVYNIKIGGNSISYNKLLDPQREMVFSSLAYYDNLNNPTGDEQRVEKVIDDRLKSKLNTTQLAFVKSRLLNNAAVKDKYPIWLLRYIGDMRMLDVASIQIERSAVNYSAGKIQILHTDTLAIYSDETE
jgi:hypothetical protein